MAIRSDADVEALVEEGGIEALRDLVASPTALHPKDRAYVANWLREQVEKGKIEREDEAHDFMRRQTIAAEESAAAAQTSAKWAMWGAVIAAAMLFATAWPYFKLVDALSRLAK
jgi:hypothetical protein